MKLNVELILGLISLLTLAMFSLEPISLAQVTSHVNNTTMQLYGDNFSTSKNSGFYSYTYQKENGYFENGKYRFTVNQTNDWARLVVGNDYSDIILEVEATQVSGPSDNAYGIIMRAKNSSTGYFFLISGDGYYTIIKSVNDTYTSIKSVDDTSSFGGQKLSYVIPWKKSSAIHTGNATNLIRVVSDGDKFSFYVNKKPIGNYTDDSFGKGMIGLMAGTNYGFRGAVTIDFDNLTVWGNSK